MINWSRRGQLRLRQCARYILTESQDWLTVVNWCNDVDAAVQHLEFFPLSGSIVRELHRPDIRQTLVGDYRVIYRVRDNIPEILSVRHVRFLIQSLHSL